jgi:hypothetical protein
MTTQSIDIKSDPNMQPVSSIQTGWVLQDGSLYVLVMCQDGVVRPTTLEKKRR